MSTGLLTAKQGVSLTPHQPESQQNSANGAQANAHTERHSTQRSEHVAGGSANSRESLQLASEPGNQKSGERGYSSRNTRSSANHLLNFQYQQHRGGGPGGGRSSGGTYHGARAGGYNRRYKGSSGRPQKYDRNKFLQANYRFLVSDGLDAAAYHADADRMFDWEDVLQVELLSTGPVKCPISLDSPPVCPQITPCGHIYSFPAIMQHLVHHGGEHLKRWAPCPLCFEPVVARDLRMVLITPVTPPQVGSEVTFQLLKRGRTTIIPEPTGTQPPTDLATGSGTGPTSSEAEGAEGAGPSGDERTPQQAVNPKPGGARGALPPVGAAAAGRAGTRSAGVAVGLVVGAELPIRSQEAGPAASSALALNRWAKFAITSAQGALGLWREAAKQLAEYAAEVTSEGGMDAAVVAPYVFMSLEALATRARTWARRRGELLVARATRAAHVAAVAGTSGTSSQTSVGAGAGSGGPGPGQGHADGNLGTGAGSVDPQQEGAAAEATVKQMFMAAVHSVSSHAQASEQQAALAYQFPSLAPAPAATPGKPGATPAAGAQQPPAAGGAGTGDGAEEGATAQALLQPSNTGAATAAAAGQRALSPSAATFTPGSHPASTSQAPPAAEQAQEGPSEASEQPTPDHEFAFQAAFSDCEEGGEPEDSSPMAAAVGGSADVGVGGHSPAGSHGNGHPSHAPEAGEEEGPEQAGGGKQGGGEAVLGTSPNNLTAVNYINTCGDFYMYQAVDGQWVFLDPLCVRILLAHYGSYEACPAVITAPLVDLERMEQTEYTRKRWRFLSHLPLTGSFLFAEVALTGLLPAAALAPFAEELAARDKRRKQRARAERRQAAAEAAAARAAASARQGPTAKELAAMPALSPAALLAAGPQPTAAEAEALEAARALGFTSVDELSASVALQASLDARQSPPAAATGGAVSFAQLTKLGFAATGPALLGASPPAGLVGSAGSSSGGVGPQAKQPKGAWANKPAAAAAKQPAAAGSGSGSAAPAAAGSSIMSSLMQTYGFTLPASPAAAPAPASVSSSAQPASTAIPSTGVAATGSGSVGVGARHAGWAGACGASAAAAAATASAAQPQMGGSSAKKGGKKGTVLFSSGAARRY